jgi:phosphoglycolate phosphatase
MMKPVDLLVFDLDGTLIDSSEDLTASVNHALIALGFSKLSTETVKKFVGDGVSALMKRALGDLADGFYAQGMELFINYYSEHLLDKTILYPDVRAFLSHFKAKKKIIITNKMKRFTFEIVDALQIRDSFLDIIGEDSTPFKKPDPRLLQLVMETWQTPPAHTVVIGDGPNDIMLAQKAGAVSCALLNGISEREKLLALSPDICCESLSDLKNMIC